MTRLRQIVDAISMLPDTEHHAEGRAAVLAELDVDISFVKCRFSSSQRPKDKRRSTLWVKCDANGWIVGAIRIARISEMIAQAI